jgi:hypothetical protein
LAKNEWMADDGQDKDEGKESTSSESELDDNMPEEEKERRRYRKRKALPGFNQGQNQYFTDPNSGKQMYKDPNDGSTYEWDADKRAWFPVMTDDFLAQYQINYGFDEDGKIFFVNQLVMFAQLNNSLLY